MKNRAGLAAVTLMLAASVAAGKGGAHGNAGAAARPFRLRPSRLELAIGARQGRGKAGGRVSVHPFKVTALRALAGAKVASAKVASTPRAPKWKSAAAWKAPRPWARPFVLKIGHHAPVGYWVTNNVTGLRHFVAIR